MVQDKRFKFALVAHSMELAEIVKAYSDPKSEILLTRVVDLDDAIPVAKGLIKDLITTFLKAREYGREIGLTSFSEPIDGIDVIENLLDIKVHQLIFNSGKELSSGSESELISCLYCSPLV